MSICQKHLLDIIQIRILYLNRQIIILFQILNILIFWARVYSMGSVPQDSNKKEVYNKLIKVCAGLLWVEC